MSQSAKYRLRSSKRKAEEEAIRENANEGAIIPASILQINANLNTLVKIVFDSAAPQMLTSKISDIIYRIGNRSILLNFQFLSTLFNINTAVPIKYKFSDESLNKITINIIFNKRQLLTANPYNCITMTLQKHNPIDEIISISPNLWDHHDTIVNETIGNVFTLNVSDEKKDQFIITNIHFGTISISNTISQFLKKILILNIHTLPLHILNTIYKIKFKFGNILSNLNFIYQWFNILNSINCNTIINGDIIIFRMVLHMRDIRPPLFSIMDIYLKKYDDQISSIQTNIIPYVTGYHDEMADHIFEYENNSNIANSNIANSNIANSNIANRNNTDRTTWIIDKIIFVQ